MGMMSRRLVTVAAVAALSLSACTPNGTTGPAPASGTRAAVPAVTTQQFVDTSPCEQPLPPIPNGVYQWRWDSGAVFTISAAGGRLAGWDACGRATQIANEEYQPHMYVRPGRTDVREWGGTWEVRRRGTTESNPTTFRVACRRGERVERTLDTLLVSARDGSETAVTGLAFQTEAFLCEERRAHLPGIVRISTRYFITTPGCEGLFTHRTLSQANVRTSTEAMTRAPAEFVERCALRGGGRA